MRDRIVKSVFWLVWSRVVLQGMSFVSTIVVARLLSPSDYGVMALASIWTSIGALLAELGLGAAIVQFRDLDDRELNTCFWLAMSVAVCGYGMLYVAAPMIAAWFDSPRLSVVLRVVGLSLPIVALRVVPDGLLRRRLQLDQVSRAEVLASLVTIPVVLGLAWAGAGVWALVAGVLVMALIQSSTVVALVKWRPGLQMGGRGIAEILHYSLAMLGSRVSWAVYEQTDAFVLGKISGAAVLGTYSMAKQLALLPVEKVSAMVLQLAVPVMAELQADRERLRAAFLRGVRLVAWVTFPLCIGLMLVARELVELLLTKKWVGAVTALQVLCGYALIRSVAILLPPVLMAQCRANFLFGYNVALLVIMPVAFWGGSVWWGATGVAVAWVLVYPAILTTMAREAIRSLGLSLELLWAQLWPPIAATAAMVASVLLVRWAPPSWPHQITWMYLALLVLVGAGTYGAALLACGGPIRREMKEVAGWLLHRDNTLTAK